jgi:selenocysteine lyase/cysteine desulfurase
VLRRRLHAQPSLVRRRARRHVAAPAFNRNAFSQLAGATRVAGGRAAAAVAPDEEYWSGIQRAFDVDRTLVNLNNGGVSPAPTHVLDAMIRDLRFSNELPVEHMWRVLEPRVESVRREVAREFGCDPEELAITRNASEANEIMIFGLDLRRGDEVVVSNQNYPRMITAWEQRARRDGIVLKQVSFPGAAAVDEGRWSTASRRRSRRARASSRSRT